MTSLVSPAAAEALEEVTAGKVFLVLLAIGAASGAAYYFATRPKTAAAAASAPPVAASARPTPPTNTFSPTPVVQVPPGINVTVIPGQKQTLAIIPGDSVTLSLPAGASWKQIVIGKSDNSAFAPVTLGTDLSSPVSIALSTLQTLGYNAVAAQWTDAMGQTQAALYAIVVEHKPLTLHV